MAAPAIAQHSRNRYLERYGAPLTMADLRELERRLAAGEGLIVRRNADGAEVRVIRHAGRLVTAVYAGGTVKTFLPADAPLKSGRFRGAA